jgi:hypothetical protein
LIFRVLQMQIPHPPAPACGRQGRQQANGAGLPTAGRFGMTIGHSFFFAARKTVAVHAVRAEAARGMRTKDNRTSGQGGFREKAQSVVAPGELHVDI